MRYRAHDVLRVAVRSLTRCGAPYLAPCPLRYLTHYRTRYVIENCAEYRARCLAMRLVVVAMAANWIAATSA